MNKIITAEQLKKIDKEGITLEGELNEVIYIHTKRKNGSLRVQQDFQFCPTLAEQHTAHLTDINYLVQKYKPDELAQYISARTQHRQEIIGHDFSAEPSLQDAKNVVVRSKNAFNELPDDFRSQFKNHLEFLKFIDNDDNVQKLIKLGVLTPKQIQNIKIDDPISSPIPTETNVPKTTQTQTP